jgi:hypothetical protein
LQSKYKDTPADAIKKVFAVFDKDGNGLLEADEIKAMVDVLLPTASQSVKDAKLKHADANEDGKISMSKFLDIIWPTKAEEAARAQAEERAQQAAAERQARQRFFPLPQKKKQRVDECETSGESDISDESEASDEEAAVDQYLRTNLEQENLFDEDEYLWGQENCPPCFCIATFEGFYDDAYQCDDDDYWQQPRISTLAWSAATEKGISKCGGSLRTAAKEAVREEIETRLEASSAWSH